MEICCTLWKFCVILWKFVVTFGNFVSQGSAKRGVFFRPFGVGRGRSGSVGVGRGTGTFSGPIRAPESDRSELWKLSSTFMENFHGQSCTKSIMEICRTLWKKSVYNEYFMEISSTLWKFVVLYGNSIAFSWKKKMGAE